MVVEVKQPVTMAVSKGWQARGAIGLVVAVSLLLAGCGDCRTEAFERVEQWLQHDPSRPGKVGMLRGLEVADTARRTAHRYNVAGEGPCDIDWQLDESFSVEFELMIEVERTDGQRKWHESGSWQRDEDGRWLLEADVEFQEITGREGTRTWRVFSGHDGIWEWLGPEVTAVYPPGSAVGAHWKNEFSSRFTSLMSLVSEGWSQADDGDWKPGSEPIRCGPRAQRDQVDAWRPLVDASVALDDARIVGYQDREEGRCRLFEARYRRRGGDLSIEYRECSTEDAPTRLQRPEAERSVDIARDRRRMQVSHLLDEWLDDGIVEPVDNESGTVKK